MIGGSPIATMTSARRSQSTGTKPGRGTEEMSIPPRVGMMTASSAMIQTRDPSATSDKVDCFALGTRP